MVSLVCQFLCCIFYVLYYASLGSYPSIHYPYVHVNEVCVVSRRRARQISVVLVTFLVDVPVSVPDRC